MIISKNPELFLPNGWPSYFKKTKARIFGTWMEKNILTCH